MIPPSRSSGDPHTDAASRSVVVFPRLVSPEMSTMKFGSIGRYAINGGIIDAYTASHTAG